MNQIEISTVSDGWMMIRDTRPFNFPSPYHQFKVGQVFWGEFDRLYFDQELFKIHTPWGPEQPCLDYYNEILPIDLNFVQRLINEGLMVAHNFPIVDDRLFYLRSRGIDYDHAIAILAQGGGAVAWFELRKKYGDIFND